MMAFKSELLGFICRVVRSPITGTIFAKFMPKIYIRHLILFKTMFTDDTNLFQRHSNIKELLTLKNT